MTVVDVLGILGDDGDDGDGGDGGDGDGGGDGGAAPAHASVLSILRRVRLTVYFCLGFGPTGLYAELTGASTPGALAWAVPAGIVTTFLARATMRFQRRTIDSTVRDDELLLARGEVTVPLSHGDMGRVRVRLAQSTVERYALAEDAGTSLSRGADVEIVRVTDECVYVRPSAGARA